MNETLKQEIIDYIIHLVEPSEIILFGSYASGMQRNNSDIDLLIISRQLHNRHQLKKDISNFILQFGYPSDILLMTENELKSELSGERNFLFNALKISQKIYKN